MNLADVVTTTERATARLQARLGRERVEVTSLPRTIQEILRVSLGPRHSVNSAEVNQTLRGALRAVEEAAGGLFRTAGPETVVDAAIVARAERRHPGAAALVALVRDRLARQTRLAPALVAQRALVKDLEALLLSSAELSVRAGDALRLLFSMPLPACLDEATARLRKAGHTHAAQQAAGLRRRLDDGLDDAAFRVVAERARALLLEHAFALSGDGPLPARPEELSRAAAVAQAQLEALTQAAATLPD